MAADFAKTKNHLLVVGDVNTPTNFLKWKQACSVVLMRFAYSSELIKYFLYGVFPIWHPRNAKCVYAVDLSTGFGSGSKGNSTVGITISDQMQIIDSKIISLIQSKRRISNSLMELDSECEEDRRQRMNRDISAEQQQQYEIEDGEKEMERNELEKTIANFELELAECNLALDELVKKSTGSGSNRRSTYLSGREDVVDKNMPDEKVSDELEFKDDRKVLSDCTVETFRLPDGNELTVVTPNLKIIKGQYVVLVAKKLKGFNQSLSTLLSYILQEGLDDETTKLLTERSELPFIMTAVRIRVLIDILDKICGNSFGVTVNADNIGAVKLRVKQELYAIKQNDMTFGEWKLTIELKIAELERLGVAVDTEGFVREASYGIMEGLRKDKYSFFYFPKHSDGHFNFDGQSFSGSGVRQLLSIASLFAVFMKWESMAEEARRSGGVNLTAGSHVEVSALKTTVKTVSVHEASVEELTAALAKIQGASNRASDRPDRGTDRASDRPDRGTGRQSRYRNRSVSRGSESSGYCILAYVSQL
jgi:hypothetical protein